MGKGIVLLWRKVGGENIPRLTGRTGCPNRNSTEEPVPEAGSRYRRGFSFVARLPRTRPGTGSIREGAFCPMPCIRGLAQELLSLSPGVWTERRRSIPEIFCGHLPRTPALAHRGIFTGRGIVPPGSAPGFCPVPRPSPAGAFLSEQGQFCPAQLPVNQPL